MHRFDYSFLETVSFPADIVSKASRIESMRGRWESVIKSHPAVVSDMEAAARVMSMRESNAIEAVLGEMVREGVVRKVGGNRNARYIRASDEVWS